MDPLVRRKVERVVGVRMPPAGRERGSRSKREEMGEAGVRFGKKRWLGEKAALGAASGIERKIGRCALSEWIRRR